MDPVELQMITRQADEMIRRGRSALLEAIRRAYAEGMSEEIIAESVGKSQPEVIEIIHFHGSTRNGLAIRKARTAVLDILKGEGLSNPRVFGSTARESDGEMSDINLLVSSESSVRRAKLVEIMERLTHVVGIPVDLVLDSAIREDLTDSILDEAIPL